MTADSCARHGLEVAALDRKTLDKLDSLLPPTGRMAIPWIR
jgi:acyl-CoA synthetase (NDP forming)